MRIPPATTMKELPSAWASGRRSSLRPTTRERPTRPLLRSCPGGTISSARPAVILSAVATGSVMMRRRQPSRISIQRLTAARPSMPLPRSLRIRQRTAPMTCPNSPTAWTQLGPQPGTPRLPGLSLATGAPWSHGRRWLAPAASTAVIRSAIASMSLSVPAARLPPRAVPPCTGILPQA